MDILTDGRLEPRAAAAGVAGRKRYMWVADRFDATASVTVCAFTTDETDAPLCRLLVVPDGTNGIRGPSRLMVDRITTIPRSKLGERVGRLVDEDMVRLDRVMLVFLGLAGR